MYGCLKARLSALRLQEDLQTWNGMRGNASSCRAGVFDGCGIRPGLCGGGTAAGAEAARRLALLGLNILDTPAEARFDQIIYLAKLTFGFPIAYIAFVDEERQWIKARIGMTAQENHRAQTPNPKPQTPNPKPLS